jgi:hypothetical protein
MEIGAARGTGAEHFECMNGAKESKSCAIAAI